ncbi:TonB-dependent receptor [Marivirga sp.]|uniref:TonB-dependent receptor n=1 Tax=Marivirga sp. TaxID=2018662 RepID=UPI0025F6EDDB|nr:TonB-dependent receptor [Marivirga sp.]
MLQFTKKWFLSALAVVMSIQLMAQSSISGKVVSQEDNSPLVGASVVIESLQKGIATDIDGNYRINNIKAGQYEFKVSYIGYKQVVRKVKVESQDITLNFELEKDAQLTDEVMVSATRADENTPTTFTNIKKAELERQNLGQDMPMLLNYTPSMVTTSDAGAGVGYTGMRIRGSDGTRINVTVNGIPINDSESHGTFWVNMPDLASSVDNIQIQRGVGTSTNGAAAFGASVNMQTSTPSQEAFGEVNNSYGSFNTRKHNIIFNSGITNSGWSFEGRLSSIHSDGYIDRASSDMQSYFLSGAYYGDKTIVKALAFGGKEKTYQSWWGTPEARLENDVEGMQEVIMNNGYTDEQAENLLNSGRTFNYYLYDNETDNYQQDHYQLHLSHQFTKNLQANAALHYTYGRGYYEQYRMDDDLADYQLDDVVIGNETISSTDLVRRRWLDNHFYGVTYSLNYQKDDWDVTLGGAYNEYDGDHFGEIIWARFAGDSEIRERYYDNYGRKYDFNTFLKANYQVDEKINLFADMQIRNINYVTQGIDNDLTTIDTGGDYFFFNPKAGLTYSLPENSQIYASVAVANREPVRNDFVDAPQGVTPQPETLYDYEIGYKKQVSNFSAEAIFYYMDYKNQLVLTGELNDVGSSIRTNVENSYRSGIELIGAYQLNQQWSVGGNATFSQNKISNFTEVIYDYGENWDEFNIIENEYTDTDISFSPNIIAAGEINYQPVRGLKFTLLGKYVGKQYLDNTSNDERALDPYFVSDFVGSYQFSLPFLKTAELKLMVNNIFNEMYSSNGYTFGYNAGTYSVRENYLYPQAGTNFLLGLNLRF